MDGRLGELVPYILATACFFLKKKQGILEMKTLNIKKRDIIKSVRTKLRPKNGKCKT